MSDDTIKLPYVAPGAYPINPKRSVTTLSYKVVPNWTAYEIEDTPAMRKACEIAAEVIKRRLAIMETAAVYGVDLEPAPTVGFGVGPSYPFRWTP